MNFNLIDIENWKRKEHYLHYMQSLRCMYSLTTNIDITSLMHEIKNMNKNIPCFDIHDNDCCKSAYRI